MALTTTDNINEEKEPAKVDPYADLTVKDLQEEAVKLGMPAEDAKVFTTKAPLIATINTLKATGAQKVVQKVATLDPPEDPKEEREVVRRLSTKAEEMRAMLLSQPQVSINLALGPSEKPGNIEWRYNKKTKREEQVHISGAYQRFQLNGYVYLVPKGIRVNVPQRIADEIEQSERETAEAGANISMDRTDPETGKPYSEVL